MSSRIPKSDAVKVRLENWISSNGLDDFSFSELPPRGDSNARSRGAEDVLLVLNIDGRLYEIFWGGHSPGYPDENNGLRTQFDELVRPTDSSTTSSTAQRSGSC